MRKIIQILDETGAPVAGHVFEAPDEGSLEASMVDLPAGRWHEVPSEEDLVILSPVDEPGTNGPDSDYAN